MVWSCTNRRRNSSVRVGPVQARHYSSIFLPWLAWYIAPLLWPEWGSWLLRWTTWQFDRKGYMGRSARYKVEQGPGFDISHTPPTIPSRARVGWVRAGMTHWGGLLDLVLMYSALSCAGYIASRQLKTHSMGTNICSGLFCQFLRSRFTIVGVKRIERTWEGQECK